MDLGSHPTAATHPGGTILTSPPQDAPVDRATAAARRVVDAMLRTDRGNANLDRVAEELNSIAEHLEQHSPEVAERLIDMWNGEGVTRHDPVTGPENAIAPPLVLEGLADGSVQGVVTLTLPYQGPPGHVHGGCFGAAARSRSRRRERLGWNFRHDSTIEHSVPSPDSAVRAPSRSAANSCPRTAARFTPSVRSKLRTANCVCR